MNSANSVNLSEHKVVFCDSLQALEWAYKNGLSDSSIIKTSSPSVLWGKKKNIHNIESRWTVKELNRFQSTIQGLTKSVFDVSLSINGIDRELALTISHSIYQFHKVLYKIACLEGDDFTNSRLFIHVSGKTGPAGNMMNSPWDQLLSSNPLLSVVNYTLRNDEWKVMTTKGISYLQRFKVAGYETLIYRLAIKLTEKIPDWIFKKELIMPNENELNIEIASALALSGVKISKAQLEPLSNSYNTMLDINTMALYKAVLPIMRKQVSQWVNPAAIGVTMELFESHLMEQLKQFKLLTDGWEKAIVKNNRIKKAVLVNAPGNIKGYALSYVCRKNNIPLMSSQHGVTIEISKMHDDVLHIKFDNSVTDAIFSYNYKIVDIEKKAYFNKSKHYVVGMPMRLIRMKYIQTIVKPITPIVYISTNLYHMGLSLSLNTDYRRARAEQRLVTEVLSELPHKILYKTYPEDNRRYADVDPVLDDIKAAKNIEIFSDKIDMRYLISKHRVLVTTCATSTLGWVVMSGKPVVFINQKNNSPLTDDAYVSLSRGMFVFDDKDPDFYNKLKIFLSMSFDQIENLWQKKQIFRKEMIKEYFSEYKSGAGARAAKIILKEFL